MKEIQDFERKYFYVYYATDTNNGIGRTFHNLTTAKKKRSFHHFTTEKWKIEFHHFTTVKRKRSFHHFTTTKWRRAFHHFTIAKTKGHVPDDPGIDPSLSGSSLKKKKRDRKKSVRNTGNVTHKTHHRSTIMVRPTIVITDTNDVRGKAIRKSIR